MPSTPYAVKTRIGIMSNNEHDCIGNDSRLGFGTGGYLDPGDSCGNTARWNADNGDKSIPAIGSIFVN